MVFGEAPARIASTVVLGRTGVDEQDVMALEYSGGRIAALSCSVRFNSPQEAHIIGTQGRIRIHKQWWLPDTITVSLAGKADETLNLPYLGNGYPHEAVEVMECLRGGKLESAVMPLDESLRIMRTLDAIRAPWGLKYPGE